MQGRLGYRVTRDCGVGGVTHHGVHALVCQIGEGFWRIAMAYQRLLIQLPVTAVEDVTGGGANHQGIRVRDGVSQRQPLHAEWPDLLALAGLHFDDRHPVQQVELRELATQNFGREPAGVYRALQQRPEVGYSSDMIFVGVGNYQARQPFTAVSNERRIRHLNRRLATMMHRAISSNATRLWKGNTTIHHQPGTIVAIEVEVHTNFTGSTQRQKPEIRLFGNHSAPRSMYFNTRSSCMPSSSISFSAARMSSAYFSTGEFFATAM